MRTFVLSAIALAGLWVPAYAADDVNAEDIIRKFAAKELEFQQARNNYTYRQSVKLEEVDGGGKWEEVDDIIFTPDGKRIEKVIYAPVVSLHHINLSPEDVQDLRNVQPFVLTTPEIEDICYERGFLFYTTHASDPLPAAVGLKVLEIVMRDKLTERARTLGLAVRLLEPMRDIDTLDDLRAERARLAPLLARSPGLAAAVAAALAP